MGAYDSSKFSKMFSERTEDNLRFITNFVKDRKTADSIGSAVLERIESSIIDLEQIEKTIATELGKTQTNKHKANSEVKNSLYSIKSKISNSRKELEKEKALLEKTVDRIDLDESRLFEVTQLLNSLMGIAVLPYEMHKIILTDKTHEDRGKLLSGPMADELRRFIMFLFQERKWVSSYNTDEKILAQSVADNEIVSSFLSHIRNAVCHSGDNALSILPLSEGKIIEEVLFYDHLTDRDTRKKQEFAMRLTLAELTRLVDLISAFYKGSMLGDIDKSDDIKRAERQVNRLLKEGQR